MSLKSQIESLLFISAKPMSVGQLSDLTKADKDEVAAAGDALVAQSKADGRGIAVIKDGKSYQMVSSPENARLVQEFIKDETTGELSRPSLEALTIIAYRGPVAKADLDRIRGVNCAMILRNLLLRGLIEAKYDNKLKQNYYNVTLDFIRFLGLSDIKELPDFEKLSKDDRLDRVLAGAEKATELTTDIDVAAEADDAKKLAANEDGDQSTSVILDS